MEKKARIWPKMDDIIHFETKDTDIQFKVVEYDMEAQLIKLVSLDEYQEEVEFNKMPHLTPVKEAETGFADAELKANYRYNAEEYQDYVTPDITATIHVNSETDDHTLKKLPGIGVRAVKDLKKRRPFKNVQEVMDAKIGVGKFWGEEWQEGVDKGTIVFD